MSIFQKRNNSTDDETDIGEASTVRGSTFTGLASIQKSREKNKNRSTMYDSRMDNTSQTARVTVTGPREVLVFEDYDADMEDEMICTSGDMIWVEEEFDDGKRT